MTAAKRKHPDSAEFEVLPNRDTYVTPIFDKAMGRRLKTARMRKFMDQKELGNWLGVSQSVISDLELGNVKTGDFNLARLRALFGDATNYILTGSKREQYETANVTKDYWRVRLASCGRFSKKEKKHEKPE